MRVRQPGIQSDNSTLTLLRCTPTGTVTCGATRHTSTTPFYSASLHFHALAGGFSCWLVAPPAASTCCMHVLAPLAEGTPASRAPGAPAWGEADEQRKQGGAPCPDHSQRAMDGGRTERASPPVVYVMLCRIHRAGGLQSNACPQSKHVPPAPSNARARRRGSAHSRD